MIAYPFEGKPPWPHTCYGLHMQPKGHWTDWKDPKVREYELGVLRRTRSSWITGLSQGGSILEVIDGKSAAEWLLDEQVVPLIRYHTSSMPTEFLDIVYVRQTVQIWNTYGIRPTWILWNEPGDEREWKDKKVPENWKEVFLGLWINAARRVIEAGAIAGFPDPLGEWPWFFERLPPDIVDAFRDGRAIICVHAYGKNRPPKYPLDPVSLYGAPLTEAEWRAALGPFWDVPGYREVSLDQINAQRAALANPNPVVPYDPTCFGAWRANRYWFKSIHGFEPVMCLTEGGWTPKDTPGSGPNNDWRWPVTTPAAIRDHTLEVIRDQADHGMFAMTFWISHGWSYDGWFYNPLACIHNDCFDYPECYEQPIIHALEASSPSLLLAAARADVALADHKVGELEHVLRMAT